MWLEFCLKFWLFNNNGSCKFLNEGINNALIFWWIGTWDKIMDALRDWILGFENLEKLIKISGNISMENNENLR